MVLLHSPVYMSSPVRTLAQFVIGKPWRVRGTRELRLPLPSASLHYNCRIWSFVPYTLLAGSQKNLNSTTDYVVGSLALLT